jgi:PPE-repeat protein
MSFSLFPPEFNSELIYAARGSGQLGPTASAWDLLAAGLHSTANSFRPVISHLVSNCPGPSMIEIAGAASHYASWVSATAAQVADVAAKATAAAAGLETAFAMTVPPQVIAANRARLRTLAAANLLGQDAPAVAATEAHYLEMWAQDAVAINGYMAAWHYAVRMSAYGKATATRNATGGSATSMASAPDGAGGLATLTSSSSEMRWALSSLTAAASAPGAVGQLVPTDSVSVSTPATEAGSSASAPERLAMYPISMLAQASQICETDTAILTSNSDGPPDGRGQHNGRNAELPVGAVTDQLHSWESAVCAQMASATSLGGLSIPPRWPAAAAGLRPATSVSPTNSTAPSHRRRIEHAVGSPTNR